MSIDSHFMEFANPFVGALENVFETMIFTKVESQEPIVKNENISRGDITAVLGLNGSLTKEGVEIPFKAMVVISYPYDTYFKIASAMLGETYTAYVPDIQDVGSEIVNMVIGNAKRILKPLGYAANMAIPSITEGQNHSVTYPKETQAMQIGFISPHGPFCMEICYSEK